MKFILAISLLLAFQTSDCGDQPKPVPKPPSSGQEAIRVDGRKGAGVLQKHPNDSTYDLRYPDGSVDKVSANEVILLPMPRPTSQQSSNKE